MVKCGLPFMKATVPSIGSTTNSERALSRAGSLGLDVSIDQRGEGGTLHIKYRDLDQLDAVLRKLDRG